MGLCVQHSRNSAVVDGLIGIDRLRIVLFNQAVNPSKPLDVVPHFSVPTGDCVDR